MANDFVAVTKIEGGRVVDNGVESYSFETGDLVTGLDTETMKQLWDAGALKQRNTDEVVGTKGSGDSKSATVTPAAPKTSPTPATPKEGDSDGK
jgi:hypothetical protein